MKEYIKLFNNLESADGYLIEDIPFTTTVKRDTESLAPQNLRCDKSNRQYPLFFCFYFIFNF